MSSFLGRWCVTYAHPRQTLSYIPVFFSKFVPGPRGFIDRLVVGAYAPIVPASFCGRGLLVCQYLGKMCEDHAGTNAAGGVGARENGDFSGFPCDEKGCLYVSGKLGEINLMHSCKLYS